MDPSRGRIRENGPYAVAADVSMGDSTFTRATLCRCVGSSTRPFCDGSHARIGFKS